TQAGTPQLRIAPTYDARAHTLTLALRQTTNPTPGQDSKKALPIPIRLGLLSEKGETLTFDGGKTETLIVLRESEETVVLRDVMKPPVLSALRHFSAPVILKVEEPENHAFARLLGDSDPFNRWEAAQGLARDILLAASPVRAMMDAFASGLKACLEDKRLEPAFKALMLGLPTESDLAQSITPVDPAFLHANRKRFKAFLSHTLKDELCDAYDSVAMPNSFSPDARDAGDRAFRNALLDLILAGYGEANDKDALVALAQDHVHLATNMTDMVGGLQALMHVQGEPYQEALDAFYERFRNEPLVIDKWFSLQAGSPHPETLARVEALSHHPDFDAKVPNRWRALVQAFANNQSVFHDPHGRGYDFLVRQILTVDGFNPMTAARLIEPLSRFRAYAQPWRDLMQKALDTILAAPNLSKNVAELAGKARNG
ncbi:MAG: DUF3458 domain-containing protein, partial [Asticcacaulis sp.]|nr:DUF3458 domain-containing protein [Asticcacaulis sp.]